MSKNFQYAALLRGINVGGNHKVPMAELSREMTRLGFENVITLLNSGNVMFDAALEPEEELEERLAHHLAKAFGFPIPVLIRKAEAIQDLIQNDPFKEFEVTNDIRLYISFLKAKPSIALALPWTSSDGSYRILEIRDRTICSVLDLAITSSPKGMDALEQLFGKNITTRNWNTIIRMANRCKEKDQSNIL
jgi:uncharacterized protein (DUF1697 family)